MTDQAHEGRSGGRTALLVVAWLWVLVPFAYGLYELIRSVTRLFG